MEIDVAAGYRSVEDVEAMIGMIRATFTDMQHIPSFVIAADWRQCKLFNDAVAARARQMLTVSSDRIERSAILHRADQPTSVLQVFRLVKESEHEARRVFKETSELETFLDPVLTADEQARLRTFLRAS